MSEGLKLARPRYPALKRGKKKKQHATQNDGARRHAESGKTKRAIQSSIALRVHMKNGRDGAEGSAAQFHPTKVETPNRRKMKNRNQEGGIYGKDRCSENTGKGEHREKQRIPSVTAL